MGSSERIVWPPATTPPTALTTSGAAFSTAPTASTGSRSGKAEMFGAITTRAPMANTSLHALAAAMAPKSPGSSTSGGKKSVVDTRARSSIRRSTGGASKGASPTSRSDDPATSSRSRALSGAAPHFAAQPPQDVHSSASRRSSSWPAAYGRPV